MVRSFGVVRFPGSNCDYDCFDALGVDLNQKVCYLWHMDDRDIDVDVVILPGGFSYGDYVRVAVVASCSPIMSAVKRFVDKGGIVLGICNGFQILVESQLLPGSLLSNYSGLFLCREVQLEVVDVSTPFTCGFRKGEFISLPVAHKQGRYFSFDQEIVSSAVFRYVSSSDVLCSDQTVNGSFLNIAGVRNQTGRVLGLMPHPERSMGTVFGSDGRRLFQNLLSFLRSNDVGDSN